MRNRFRVNVVPFAGRLRILLAATLAVTIGSASQAQSPSLEDVLSGVVRIKTFINPEGRTVPNLGRERDGSGIVIDQNGLILTIGYLMVEAHAAEVITNDGRSVPATVVGYDQETGFGLLRTSSPLKVRPLPFGKSAGIKEKDPVLAASFGGLAGVAPAYVVARREFAGEWEYLIDEAIFTAPAHSHWSGAALITRDGKLVGVGSLIVGDATGNGGGVAGNMYVPIDLLAPIFAELIADGHVSAPPRPWLGVSTSEVRDRLFVSRVTADGPAEKAGLQRGDVILGVNGEAPKSLADFYRKIWARGSAGVTVPLDVLQKNDKRRIDIKSMNRLEYLRLKSTL